MAKIPSLRQPMLSCSEVRRCDVTALERFHVPGIVLMENAGKNAAQRIVADLKNLSGKRVAVLIGPGNNGGDGLVVARHLANVGIDVTLYLSVDSARFKGDALTNWQICSAMNLNIVPLYQLDQEAIMSCMTDVVSQAHLVIDALLGTGTTGSPREPIRTIIAAVNACRMTDKIIALDIPSGLDADNGKVSDVAIKASQTITFAAAKKGFAILEAAAYTGCVHVADIGIALDYLNDNN